MHALTSINVNLSAFLLDNILKASNGGMERSLGLLSFLVSRRKNLRDNLGELKFLIKSGHPFTRFLSRLNRELSPRARKKLISNLIVRGWLTNKKKRKAFNEREGFFPPYVVSIAPTSRCNLSCDHCSSAGQKGEDLEKHHIESVIREARDQMGVHYFILTGGEPFVYPHLFSVIEDFPNCYFHIFTNGTLLDDEAIKLLERLGNTLIMISVEGSEEPTDLRREKGTYKSATGAMKRLHEAGVPFGFSVMTTSENCETVTGEEFIDWALEQGCLIGYFFNYMPVGSDPDLTLLPSPSQRDLSRRNTYRWRNEKPIFLVDPINDGPITAGCTSAGRHYVHILATGDVVPCVYNNFSTDNIKDVTLTEALKGPYLSALRRAIPFDGNTLRCCMLLDRPEFYFKTLELYHPKSNIPDEEKILKNMKPELINYSKQMKEIYDKAWKSGEWESVIKSIKWVINNVN